MTGEKEWRVVKIDAYGEGSSMLYLNIGDNRNQIKEAIGKSFNYQYITEEDDYLEYYNDLFLVRARFEDDACVKLSIEIMETEFTKSIGLTTIPESPHPGRVILSQEDGENFFEGSIELTPVLLPDENGNVQVTEPRSVLSTKTDDPDELFSKSMETYETLGIDFVDAYMNEDKSITLVYKEADLDLYLNTLEDIYNRRLGFISNDVSISKDFTKIYIYVNDETELIDVGYELLLLLWHSVLCQVYTGVEYDEWYIDLYFVNNITGEQLLELNFAEEHPGFTLSPEQWEQLFEE